MLNVFQSDAFSVASLTAAMNILPSVPGRLGELGLFTPKPITTTTAIVESKGGVLYLIPTRARGSQQNVPTRGSRGARAFMVPHIPLNDEVLADDVQGIRAFGSETEVEQFSSLVNERMASMKQSFEATKEHMRAGCIQGLVLDADGTTELYDWFDEFDITEQVVNVTLATADINAVAREAIGKVEDALGNLPYNGTIRAFCGDDFWEGLITNETVAHAFEISGQGDFFRTQVDRRGFEYGNIIWENYRAKVGTYSYMPTAECRFVPMGAPNLFQEINAPANFIETVNTPGKPYYAKQAPMKWDMGIELHSQSNPLFICNRPGALVKGVGA